MNEIDFSETQPTQVDEIPDELPVLPLKETVVFPESMTPLAVGQERSVKLIDDVGFDVHAGPYSFSVSATDSSSRGASRRSSRMAALSSEPMPIA